MLTVHYWTLVYQSIAGFPRNSKGNPSYDHLRCILVDWKDIYPLPTFLPIKLDHPVIMH